ncbi:MAG: hypothetical protein DRR19_14390 [Candidatus Parabeggiatoa sp. nov. 1]|nr:MAG: hypothetical protein DRR19_14390 [Gammaproteobacteria bacterium]HEC85944.1 hypothetical protein [Thioploca sp.]
MEPFDNIKQEYYVASIAMLLKALWDIGAKAVAACDFEDELPYEIGIAHSNTFRLDSLAIPV